MPTTTTPTHIFLGNYADLDPNEGNYTSENAADLVGEVIQSGVLELVTVTEYDGNDNGSIQDFDAGIAGPDTVSYTADGATQSGIKIDGTITANVRLTLGDLSTVDIEVVIYQTANGDVFMGDLLNGGTADNLDIVQVEVLAITGSNYAGLVTGSSIDNSNVVCFVKGTQIRTPKGEQRIENLSVGDCVLTESSGSQTIRWIGSRKLDPIDLAANPKLRPIRISAGAIGDGLPETDLLVSPQRRVLVRSVIAQRIFSTQEILLPAIKLLGWDGVDIVQDNPKGVAYFHILFDRHEIIHSNGMLTESLFTGPEALKAISAPAVAEIQTLFPEICVPDFSPAAVRHIPKSGKDIKELIRRHIRNRKPLYSVA